MGTIDTVIGVVAIGGIAAYFLIPEFQNQVNAALGGGGGGGGGTTPPGTIEDFGKGNCKQVGEYTVWKGRGCLNGKVMDGLEYASKGTCAQIRAQFLIRYKCTAPKCPYAGCTSLNAGPGCFQCRCSAYCKSKYPGTAPITKADGSCTCRRVSYAATLNPTDDRISIL